MKKFLNKIYFKFKLQFNFKKDLVYNNGDDIKKMDPVS